MNLNKLLLFISLFSVFSSHAMYEKEMLNSYLSFHAGAGHTDDVRVLLDEGADVNTVVDQGYSPLMYAAMNTHVSTCRLLLERGADVNQQTPEIGVYGKGWTALMFVISSFGRGNYDTFREEICELILKRNPNLCVSNVARETVLLIAAAKKNEHVCKLILNCESTNIKLPRIKTLLWYLRQLKDDKSQDPAIKAGAEFLYKNANKLLRKHLANVYCKPLELLNMVNDEGLRAFDYLPVYWLNSEIPE